MLSSVVRRLNLGLTKTQNPLLSGSTGAESAAEAAQRSEVLSGRIQANGPASKLSVSIVIPTYNRSEMLKKVVRKTRDAARGYDVEWVVVNDGSSDRTSEALKELQAEIPNFSYIESSNRGPGQARNLGADAAKKDIILFMGDDVLPVDDDFIRPHAELHAAFQSKRVAVLGKVCWPNSDHLATNAVMRHIQGRGGEQFGYADFTAYTFLDWRFFYTCNVSLRRDVVADWKSEGFSADFPVASFEDAEFAYRMGKKHGSFEIFYCPSSNGYHYHGYNVRGFIRRQQLAGAMAHVMTSKHPELGGLLNLNDIYEAMVSPIGDGRNDTTAEYLAAIEGIKAWACILECEHRLGNEAWHEELLFLVFDIAFLQGYITSAALASTNFAKAYARVLHRAKFRLGRIMDSEALGTVSFRNRILPT